MVYLPAVHWFYSHILSERQHLSGSATECSVQILCSFLYNATMHLQVALSLGDITNWHLLDVNICHAVVASAKVFYLLDVNICHAVVASAEVF